MRHRSIPFRTAALVLAAPCLGAAQAAPGAPTAERAAQAMAVYEDGKRLYDAKNYLGALGKFDQAAALEPDKARWQYNRGLVLRKLKRDDEAREAFQKSRALDPAYKRSEIDAKLRDMGFDPAGATSGMPLLPAPAEGAASGAAPPAAPAPARSQGFPLLPCLGCFAVVVGGLIMVVLLIRRILKGWRTSRGTLYAPVLPSGGPPRPGALKAEESRLEKLAATLAAAEHALRLREDEDLRALLNQATQDETRARETFKRARKGQGGAGDLPGLLATAEEAAAAAVEKARELFGDAAFQEGGPRVGCYFCARPLASETYRARVSLKRGTEVTEVLACPPCANTAARGQAPPVKALVGEDGQMRHWSEIPDYDPYLHRHQPYPGASLVPGWKFAPGGRSLAEVAALAGGGALAGGLLAYGAGRLLDLDTAQELGLAQEASQAAALKAGGSAFVPQDLRDHS